MQNLNWNRTEWYARTFGWQMVMEATSGANNAEIRAVFSPNSKRISTLCIRINGREVAEVNANVIGGAKAIAIAKKYVEGKI